ncbi:cytochrome C [Spirosoma sp. HMF4905]|uniref:Cytochrome C n=1 Tax=Spirosoma arboris TaxID=2682092 RepID=A0A7K1SNL8_9BACT|nr:c-type cytochrome [Spirosoma arboris]MVM35357.1 cytochrome C [Spirosoma arboris]
MKKTFGILFASAALAVASFDANAQAPADIPADMNALMQKYTCIACHRPNQRLVGPAYADVAKKKYSTDEIVKLIYTPVPSHWPGYPPMAPMTQVPKEDATKLAVWINSLDDSPKTTTKKTTKTTTKKTKKSA